MEGAIETRARGDRLSERNKIYWLFLKRSLSWKRETNNR